MLSKLSFWLVKDLEKVKGIEVVEAFAGFNY
jgi:hypothetical protein